MEGHYRIGQLAAGFGLNPKTIRYYEKRGLLAPAVRTPAGYRQYTGAERDTLRFIVKAKASGLTLAEIGAILAVRRDGLGPCQHVRDILDRKLAAAEMQLRALAAFRDELRALRDTAVVAATCDGAVCGIIERHVPRSGTDTAPAK